MRSLAIMGLMAVVLLAGCGGGDTITGVTTTPAATGTTGTVTTVPVTPTVTPASLTAISNVLSMPSDGSSNATITVLARNSSNAFIAGAVVDLATNSGGISPATATTDVTGSITGTLTLAGDPSLRDITVTATSAGLTATAKVQVVAVSSATTTAVSSLTMTTSSASILTDGSGTSTITALARDASNNVLAGVPITFQATSGAVQALAAVTDATGSVQATLSTGGDSSLRTITVTGVTAKLTSTVKVQVLAPSSPTVPVYTMGNGTGTSFLASKLDLSVNDSSPAGTLSAGGTTGLLLTIVDQTGALYTALPITVTFSSACIASGSSQILPSGSSTPVTTIITSTGSINAAYVAKGCVNADAITASATVASQNISAAGTVTIATSAIGSVQFVSASPTTIGLKGTGLNETSTVIFKVTDSTGGAKSGVPVTFALNTAVGGLGFLPATQNTATDGTVQTVVSSGTVHTAVRVTATVAAVAATATTPSSSALSTQSSELTVTTGLPASGAFSIAVGAATYGTVTSTLACPNVEAFGIDGVVVPVTVRLADRYNNPVPDGTAVAFTTNGGHIDGSCITPASTPNDGTCSVNWVSANPRPGVPTLTSGYPTQANGQPYPALLAAGRVSVLATTIGEESFTDVQGSGFWQTGDPFSDLGEPYRDDNENGQYDLGEYFLDFNQPQNGKRDPPSGTFKGITCIGSTCTAGTLAIGTSHLIIMSTSGAHLSLTNFTRGGSGFTNNTGTLYAPSMTMPVSVAAVAASAGPPAVTAVPAATYSGTIQVEIQDDNCSKDTNGHCIQYTGNSMAAGTTVTATLDNTSIGTVSVTPVTIGCNTDIGGEYFQFSFTSSTTGGSGTVTVNVTSPNGTITPFLIGMSVN